VLLDSSTRRMYSSWIAMIVPNNWELLAQWHSITSQKTWIFEQHHCENFNSCKLLTAPWNIITVIVTHTHIYPGMISWTCTVIISFEINVGHFTEFLCSSRACIAVLRRHLCPVEYRGGRVWGVQTPPPEILKFWQSWAEFPVPWKIHP
jgi:hypothetical protein